jgi:hypothetical protein
MQRRGVDALQQRACGVGRKRRAAQRLVDAAAQFEDEPDHVQRQARHQTPAGFDVRGEEHPDGPVDVADGVKAATRDPHPLL